MRFLLVSLLLLSAVCAASGADTDEAASDMGRAREWCDRAMLQGPEGIWEFTDDMTRVLVRATPGFDNSFDIFVIESPDIRLIPGHRIGSLRSSALPSRYELSLFRNAQGGILADPGKCLAEYHAADDVFVISSRKLKFRISPRWILPNFWRSLRVTVKDPLENLPHGFRRIYPASPKRKIDWL